MDGSAARKWWPSYEAHMQAQPHASPANQLSSTAAPPLSSWSVPADMITGIPAKPSNPVQGMNPILAPSAVVNQDSLNASLAMCHVSTPIPPEPLVTTVVALTDGSRELLLSLMPPLHPHVSDHHLILNEHQPLGQAMQLPLGAQVELLLTGLAADNTLQVVCTSCPDWCMPSTSAMPHIIISSATHQAAAAQRLASDHLLIDSMQGIGQGTFVGLSEPLPLYGTLGAVLDTDLLTPPVWFCVDQLVVAAYQHSPTAAMITPGAAVHHAPGPAPTPHYNDTLTVIHQSDAAASQGATTHMGQEHTLTVVSTDTVAGSESHYHTSNPVCVQDPTPPPEDEFEMWMRQDARLVNSLAPASADASSQGVLPVLVPPGATPVHIQGVPDDSTQGHVTQLSDVGVGDLVTVTPLISHDDGDDLTQESCQGIVAEIMIDDPVQPHGVLVRLEDDTLGRVVQVVLRSYRQGEAAWPTLDKAVKVVGGGKQSAPDTPSTTTKMNTASREGGKFQPAGGIRVLRTSSKPGGATQRKSGTKSSSGSADVDKQEQVLRTWQNLQRRFGEAICEAVLSDCQNVMSEAVQVMLDQDSLPERLGDIVARGVARVEQEAAEAVEEVDRVDTHQQHQLSRVTPRKWAPRPGSGPTVTYVQSGERRVTHAPERGAFPALSSSRGGASSRSSQHHPVNGRWASGAPVKLLRNSASLASAASEAGLSIKDVEALSQLFPGLTTHQVSTLLQLSGGNVNAASDELTAMGVQPGPAGCVDMSAYRLAMEVFGLTEETPQQEQQEQQQEEQQISSQGVGSGGGVDASWAEKLDQLCTGFEGLDRDMAEASLQASGGDVHVAAVMLHDHVKVMSKVHSDSDALSAQLAAQLAAESQGRPYAAAAMDKHSSGTTTPKESGGGGGGDLMSTPPPKHKGVRQGHEWKTVATRTDTRKPRTAAEIQRAKLKVSAGKARSIAQLYFDARNVFYQQAAAAYDAGDGKTAKALSQKGHEYGELAKKYRTVANDESYKMSNWGVKNELTMDLHGMHVQEAVDTLAKQIEAMSRLVVLETMLLRVITGKGNHSQNNYAAIKAAVIDWLRIHGHKHFIEPGNEGVVVVHVQPCT